MKNNGNFDAPDDKVLAGVIRQAIMFQYASDKCTVIRHRMAAVAEELRLVAARPGDADDNLLGLANRFDHYANVGDVS